MKRLWLSGVMLAVAMFATGCETMREAKEIPAPRSILEGLAVAQGEIIAVRDLTAFILTANGQNCREKPQTDLCALGFRVDERTRTLRDELDDIRDAYLIANMDIDRCRIEYAGVAMPCEDRYDIILAGVIEVRKQIAEATRK